MKHRARGWLLALLCHAPAAADELPYQPWQASDPLLKPTPLAPSGTAPPHDEVEFARRRFEAGIATSLRPVACWSGRDDCTARSLSGAARYRVTPYFAWALNAETTRFAGTRETYLGIGARAHSSRAGVTDPFIELGLGGDFGGHPRDTLLAAELSFGLSVALSEQLKLSSNLKFHERGVSCQCSNWSPWAERWVTLSIGLELWLGEKH